MKNYYAILEVPDGSSAEEIDQSYQRLLLHYQDDAEALSGLKEAHEALTRPVPPVTTPTTVKMRRCPVGADTQCPVLLNQVAVGDNFCPECGYLLAGMEAESSLEPLATPEENEQIRLEEPGGRTHLLPPGVTIVGRENADILLADKTVSRQHARLEVTADGLVMLEDLNTTNGTQVAGDRLLPHVPRQLFSGDRVRFGSFATELRLPEARPSSLPVEVVGEASLPADTALARLVELRDVGGRIVPLPPGVTTFGRRADNTVVLPGDPYVSGSHAQILATGDVFRLTDVGSTNGTLLNGERLAINAPMFLNPGDVILIGSTALRFESVAASEQETGAEETDDEEKDAEEKDAEEAAPMVHQDDIPAPEATTPNVQTHAEG